MPTPTPTPAAVTVRATYDCHYWPDTCSRCGAETRDADGAELDYSGPYSHGGGPVCPACGPLPLADVTQPDYPAEWGGWCDPANPWGTADDAYQPDDDRDAYGRGEPIVVTFDDVRDAADFLADFPGAIRDTPRECEASQDHRSGVWTRVTAHVDGPAADDALALALGDAPPLGPDELGALRWLAARYDSAEYVLGRVLYGDDDDDPAHLLPLDRDRLAELVSGDGGAGILPPCAGGPLADAIERAAR